LQLPPQVVVPGHGIEISVQPKNAQDAYVGAQGNTGISLFGAVKGGSCDARTSRHGGSRESTPQASEAKTFAQSLQLAGSRGEQDWKGSWHRV
jgi:hypothetical protein